MVNERLALSVTEAAERIGVSRAQLYPLVMSGLIPSIMVGKRRRLIPVAALERWLERQTSLVPDTAGCHKNPLPTRVILR